MGVVEKSRRLFALPPGDGLEMCRVLGLAISNVAMYGMAHSVAATTVSEAYDLFVEKSDLYGDIEFVLADAGLMINGAVVDTERSTGKLLVDQLAKLGVHDFAFTPPLNRGEFTRFALILAAVPGSSAVANGFEAAIAEAALKSVRVANVSYARVDKDAPPPAASRGTTSSGGAKSFDLALDIGMDDFTLEGEPLAAASDLDLVSAASSYLEQKQAAEENRQTLLDEIRAKGASRAELEALHQQLLSAGLSEADWHDLLISSGAAAQSEFSGKAYAGKESVETLKRLLSSADALAEHGAMISDGKPSAMMSSILESIDREVRQLSLDTTQHVDSLAEKVDADREAVATLEAEARLRGVGPNLSRAGLLASMAEINQELAQPLTAAAAVIDVLESGSLGAVTDAQRDVLAVASQGMARLGNLVGYLSKISGIPEGLSPDRAILDDVYRSL